MAYMGTSECLSLSCGLVSQPKNPKGRIYMQVVPPSTTTVVPVM
jgi:hypothetical protein